LQGSPAIEAAMSAAAQQQMSLMMCGGCRPLPASRAIVWVIGDGKKFAVFLRCNEGRKWHLTDKSTAPSFVAYWTNNGQKSAQGLNG
jgi:hypothetical protein